MMGDMDIKSTPTIAYNSEENGNTERFNRIINNAVHPALKMANMPWEYYWSWALVDATDRYNQPPHIPTVKTPHEVWFKRNKPDLFQLHMFGQLCYNPIMRKGHRASKYKDSGELVRYLCRYDATKIYVDFTTDQYINGEGDFHPFYTHTDAAHSFQSVLRNEMFEGKE